MKKTILISIIILSFQVVFGQNGLKNGNLFLLQKNRKTYSINSFKNDRINELKTFSVSKKSIIATDQRERVVVLDTTNNKIQLFHIHISKEENFSIPFDIKPKTILINQHNLFVGGEMGQELLVQYHLKNKKWYQLKIPKEVMSYGKAVDDLVVNDSLLIAVDNIIIPKYILYYKLNITDKLEYSHFKELKSNSSYESIHKARITENYLGLLSTTLNWGTHSEHITLYSDLNLLKSFAISTDYWEKLNFNDILILGNKLFIANSSKGFGVLEVKEKYFKESKDEHDIFNENIDEKLIQYKKYLNREIIRLTKIPDEPKIVLTIKNKGGKIKNEIIRIE
ncbi:hypothetical protein [Winogradskyella sp.]|uniref:hypothetical protein n=1 Tax=Winogradskyella sp. TaxID=1883156 RepID=UPI002618CFD5|nr:hypothetical protein [Winogradskyella sp.]